MQRNAIQQSTTPQLSNWTPQPQISPPMHVLQYRATKVRLFQVFSWQPKHIKMETVPPELVLGWCTLTSQPGLLVLYIAFYIAIRLDDRVYGDRTKFF